MGALDHIDSEILNDFTTEAGELIETLDQDLVSLEKDSTNTELIDSIFRALHTIKGSASFLAVDNLTNFAHAAEDALNAIRKGEASVCEHVMDLLLEAVDIIRGQIEEMADGLMPSAGPSALIDGLHEVANTDAPSQSDDTTVTTDNSDDPNRLQYDSSKMDLLPYMVDDLKESIEEIDGLLAQLDNDTDRTANAATLAEKSDQLARAVDFFDVQAITDEVLTIAAFAKAATDITPEAWAQVTPRIGAILLILGHRAEALGNLTLFPADSTQLLSNLNTALEGGTLEGDSLLPENSTPESTLEAENISLEIEEPSQQDQAAPEAASQAADSPAASKDSTADDSKAQAAEQTIRVDVTRLESLLNLVGELVLQKNRVIALTRGIQNSNVDNELLEQFAQVNSDLDRVTGELQMGVMKTRLQPLSKVFSRYNRVIRDLARHTEKKINLVIEGGETEVDKSVIEFIGDPLVHILRNSCDHGLEGPEERLGNDKGDTGTIWLSASHEGNHVAIQIRDNGRGINPAVIAKKAVEKGLTTEEQLAGMSDNQILQFVMAAGFSTAAQVSDLSGRGVGMDVVKTNIAKLNGTVDLESKVGEGTCVTIKIPLTVAIMPAMMVDISGELYAVPLGNIHEIVRPETEEISTIHGQQVMQLRDNVLPIVNMANQLKATGRDEDPRFAVVVSQGEEKLALMVHALIGQQEVVIKPLDECFEEASSVSGATVRDDGGVSLIINIAGLFEDVKKAA